ncbi:cytochrome c oxidase assembly protein [Streptomyces sediminimaris]|uniref:cytochrome c oxidase assembly protein n=1 Tax=Streptomyces sediminimaris TaxID=3383721 RepID=UPI00399A2CE4
MRRSPAKEGPLSALTTITGTAFAAGAGRTVDSCGPGHEQHVQRAGISLATASAYHGPPELTYHRALTDWHVEPALLVLLAAAAVAYSAAVRATRRRGRAVPVRRHVALAACLATVAVATASFLGQYADTLFWVRSVQLTVFFMIAPPFLALARPLSLAAAVLPAPARARGRRALRSRPARALAHPASGALLFMGLPWAVFFTGWLPAMLRDQAVDTATGVLLFAIGFVYYWSRLQLDPVPSRFSPVVSLFIAFAEVLLNAVLGLCLIYAVGAGIAHGYYAALGRPWGPSLSLDEQTGGGAYWVLGHFIGVPYLVIVFRQARHHDRRAARAIDASIDARTPDGTDADHMRPWWETDPAVAHLGLNTPARSEHRT